MPIRRTGQRSPRKINSEGRRIVTWSDDNTASVQDEILLDDGTERHVIKLKGGEERVVYRQRAASPSRGIPLTDEIRRKYGDVFIVHAKGAWPYEDN